MQLQLEIDTDTWNKNINPRLIEANEIAKITGNTTWEAGGPFYYLHTNSKTVYNGTAGTNKYAWLFDNTLGCTTYGCNVADSSNYGYWTGTAYSGYSDGAWFVNYTGSLYGNNVDVADGYGVRPVITVSKSIIK